MFGKFTSEMYNTPTSPQTDGETDNVVTTFEEVMVIFRDDEDIMEINLSE